MGKDLTSEIATLIQSHREDEWWDFKREHHHDKADLVHDIICMANSRADRDAYIIYGIEDKSFNVIGVESDQNRRNQQGSTVSDRFTKFWNMTEFKGKIALKPCVHSLRHTMITRRINLWVKQGINFEQMMPYLCKFLGHKTFSDTYYYFHYIEDSARIIREKDSTISKVIPEVVRR